MASGQFAFACRQIGRLFGSGTLAGLAEGQLLDRFLARRDDDAFEAIVARHGPMVLAVCRSLLRDPNDVDDAFQATFLVLVRKADSLRHRDLLGGWLYAVANRVARRARAEAARRRDREDAGSDRAGRAEDDLDRLDLRATVHDEVARLPESYRLAVVLCDLQGRTHEEASRELGWPVGTVKGRLSRARGLLRDRLARRGLAPSAGAVLALLADEGRAAVAPALLESTTSAASSVAAGSLAIAGAVSARVLGLTQGVLTTMTTTTTKLKLGATLLVVGALAGPGASAYQLGGGSGPPRQPARGLEELSKAAVPRVSPSADRIKLAEQAIATIQELEKRGDIPRNNDPMLRWQQRLAEAKIDAGVPRKEAMRPYLDALNAAAKDARTRFQGGEGSAVDRFEAEFRAIEAAKLLEDPQPAPSPPQAPAASPPREIPAAGGGAFGGGAFVEDIPRKPRKQHPADLERNKLIAERLEKVIAMNFSNDTPLEDVLKYVKQSTEDEKHKVIPIYVDPVGLQEAEKTVQSTITLDLDDVPLRTTLRLILAQLGMDYRIRDGMLYISDANSLNEDDHFIVPDPSDPQANPPGGTGGRPQSVPSPTESRGGGFR